ncbi:tetratricopeptide repeat protein [Brevundimonas sp.]|uniref:tetratricopeptide repeat protein n=1 Tax=Brevundimonas sp. TaxID=1871086 RepID=UPI00391D4106
MADDDKPRLKRRRATPAATTPDPIEIAMEVAATGQTPSGAALEVLRANAELTRKQLVLARNELLRNRIKTARDFALTGIALILALAVMFFVWSASQASGLVIQPFSTPPDLVTRGLDGRTIASQLQDRLNQLQDDTDSIRPANTFANNWQGDVSVEIPTTGISIGELDHSLRAALGRETVVSGEVTREGDALTITVRTGGRARSIVSDTGDVDALLQGAAEAVYEMTQAFRYGFYLLDTGRREEGLVVLRQIDRAEAPIERAFANNGLAVDRIRQGDIRGALALISRARSIYPGLVPVENNAALYRHMSGEWELALAHREAALEGLRGSGRRYLLDGPAEVVEIRSKALIARYGGDFRLAADLIGSLIGKRDYGGIVATAAIHQASLLVSAHDISAARRVLTDAGLGSVSQISERAALNENFSAPTAEALVEQGRWLDALAELQAYEAAASGYPAFAAQIPMVLWPQMAEALARLGRFEEAEALAAGMPSTCYSCVIARARVASLRGETGRADQLFAQATQQGPSLPFAYSAWAEAKLQRGDNAGALALLRDATQRGPRWADPLKLEGDALARMDRDRDAVRRYAAAAERAPRWGALHLAWGDALNRLGRRDDAAAKWRAASNMDLSASDRAQVAARLGGARR